MAASDAIAFGRRAGQLDLRPRLCVQTYHCAETSSQPSGLTFYYWGHRCALIWKCSGHKHVSEGREIQARLHMTTHWYRQWGAECTWHDRSASLSTSNLSGGLGG
jgi:hypothetical protein